MQRDQVVNDDILNSLNKVGEIEGTLRFTARTLELEQAFLKTLIREQHAACIAQAGVQGEDLDLEGYGCRRFLSGEGACPICKLKCWQVPPPTKAAEEESVPVEEPETAEVAA